MTNDQPGMRTQWCEAITDVATGTAVLHVRWGVDGKEHQLVRNLTTHEIRAAVLESGDLARAHLDRFDLPAWVAPLALDALTTLINAIRS